MDEFLMALQTAATYKKSIGWEFLQERLDLNMLQNI